MKKTDQLNALLVQRRQIDVKRLEIENKIATLLMEIENETAHTDYSSHGLYVQPLSGPREYLDTGAFGIPVIVSDTIADPDAIDNVN